jgi:hypothetical protein
MPSYSERFNEWADKVKPPSYSTTARLLLSVLALALLAMQLARIFLALQFSSDKLEGMPARLQPGEGVTDEQLFQNRVDRARAWKSTSQMAADQVLGYIIPSLLLFFIACVFAAVQKAVPIGWVLVLAFPAIGLLALNLTQTAYLPPSGEPGPDDIDARTALLAKGDDLFRIRWYELGLHGLPLLIGWAYLMFQTRTPKPAETAPAAST